MKYSLEITLNLPVDRVVELFKNPENMPKWQKGFVSMEPLSNESEVVGAQSRLRYKMKKREVEMIETITKIDFPHAFSATYEAKGVKNWIENEFVPVDENTTQWKTSNEFKFSGGMKLFGFLMPRAFKKQSFQYMKDFKAFSEQEV